MPRPVRIRRLVPCAFFESGSDAGRMLEQVAVRHFPEKAFRVENAAEQRKFGIGEVVFEYAGMREPENRNRLLNKL